MNESDKGVTMTNISSELQLPDREHLAAAANIPAPQLLSIPEHLLLDVELRAEIEQFLFFEATLLDDRRYQDWLLLCADDIHYWMPNRSNRGERDLGRESIPSRDLGLFDEDKRSLGWRVNQLATGRHWAEEPPSRFRHLVTNIRIEPTTSAGEQ